MKNKIYITAFLCILLFSCAAAAHAAPASKTMQIHLPRQIILEDETIKLGQVAVMMGEDSLVESASKIALGKFSVPGQEIVIDKSAIISLLAGNSVNTKKVKFTGAEKIIVKQNLEIITAKQLVDTAVKFLKESQKYSSAGQFSPVRLPKNITIPSDCNNIKITPTLVANSTAAYAAVQLKIDVDGRKTQTINLPFKIRYKIHKAVSIAEIPQGQIITPDKVKFITELSDTPQPPDWTAPFGLVAKSKIPANSIIEGDIAAEEITEVIIERNQSVVIKVDRPGLLLSVSGKAMEKGSLGQYIKVRNIDSDRIILAKILEDGTVEPVF